jgi:hypothetical protein
MERGFISFRASAVEPTKLQNICSRYFAYEEARTVRQLLIRRLFLVLVGTAILTLGFHLLPRIALGVVGALSIAGVWLILRIELRAKHRLIDELRDVPTADSPAIPP